MPIDSFRVREAIELTGRIRGGGRSHVRRRATEATCGFRGRCGAEYQLGFALFFDHIPASAALFVSTGVPVINLVVVGLVLGPQLVARSRRPSSRRCC